MKNLQNILLLFSLICVSVVGPVFADGHLAAAGERLSKTCASCHGTDGAAPGKLIPIIGGQVAPYLDTALQEFAAGERPGSVMANLAKGYDADEQKQIAAFFAAKPWVNTPHAPAISVDESELKSCQGCHGKAGQGQGIFPRLAGQHPEYLLEALLEYKKGERKAATMMLVRGVDEGKLKVFADNYAAMK